MSVDSHIPPSTTGQRVLVVDDSQDAADSIASLLSLYGYQVSTAYSGQEALVAAMHTPPDIVLLDLRMPDLDGLEVCRALRAQAWGSALKIVALTGLGSRWDYQQTEGSGFDLHLVKPVDFTLLLDMLAELDRDG